MFPNADEFSPAVCRVLGVRSRSSRALFAIARTTGWVAHFIEQRMDGKIIWRLANDVGPPDRQFAALEAY
jgi:2-methylcitrate synthase